jgi:hypothetical protein
MSVDVEVQTIDANEVLVTVTFPTDFTEAFNLRRGARPDFSGVGCLL